MKSLTRLLKLQSFVLPTSVEGEKEDQRSVVKRRQSLHRARRRRATQAELPRLAIMLLMTKSSKNIVIDQRKVQSNAESLEVVDDLVSSSGEEDAMNGDERGEDSLEGFVYDDETRIEKRIRKLSIASIGISRK